MTGERKARKTVDRAVRLEDSELDAAGGGDSPLWQGEESFINDVQVSSQEVATPAVVTSSRNRATVKSG